MEIRTKTVACQNRHVSPCDILRRRHFRIYNESGLLSGLTIGTPRAVDWHSPKDWILPGLQRYLSPIDADGSIIL